MTLAPITSLRPYPGNARRGNVALIRESLERLGQYRPIVVNRGDIEPDLEATILAGHHLVQAATELGWTEVDVHYVDVDADTAKRIVLVDNRANDKAGYDLEGLADLVTELPDLAGTGYDQDDVDRMLDQLADQALKAAGEASERDVDLDAGRTLDDEEEVDTGTAVDEEKARSLADRFGVPPFTVIDTRQGPWKQRAAAWKALGLASEVGREGDLLYQSHQDLYSNWYDVRNAHPELTPDEVVAQHGAQLQPYKGAAGTSIFDPALAETLVSWFSPPEAAVLDPWAGGSVRGVVSAALGRDYTGIDLRGEQVEANEAQWAQIGPRVAKATGTTPPTPRWLTGDSRRVLGTLPAGAYDMAIGCPPYYDLEEYSDDPADLSNLSTADFDQAMRDTVAEVARCLAPDSFAAFIVGSVRDRRGDVRDMRRLMVDAGEAAGLKLANDAVLLNQVGTVAVRAARPFALGRSLGRVHQDIVVLVKGDRKRAAKRCGEEVAMLDLAEAPEAA